MSSYLPPREYLPHEPPMVLIDEVLAVDEETAVTVSTVDPAGALGPFLDAQGNLPGLFALELIAQSIGIWAGFQDRESGRERSPIGLILGSRGLNFAAPAFAAGERLVTTVALNYRDGALGNFTVQVCGAAGQMLAEGSLNTCDLRPEDLEHFCEQE